MSSIGSHHYCNFPIACRTRYGVTGLERLDRVNAPFRLQVRVPQLEKGHSAVGRSFLLESPLPPALVRRSRASAFDILCGKMGESVLMMDRWSGTGRPQRQSVLHLCSNSSRNNDALGFALSSTKWNPATHVKFGTVRSLTHMNAFQMCLIWACMDQRFHYLPISLWGSLSGPRPYLILTPPEPTEKGMRAALETMYWLVKRVG